MFVYLAGPLYTGWRLNVCKLNPRLIFLSPQSVSFDEMKAGGYAHEFTRTATRNIGPGLVREDGTEDVDANVFARGELVARADHVIALLTAKETQQTMLDIVLALRHEKPLTVVVDNQIDPILAKGLDVFGARVVQEAAFKKFIEEDGPNPGSPMLSFMRQSQIQFTQAELTEKFSFPFHAHAVHENLYVISL